LFFHGFEEHGCASAGVLAIGDIAAVGSVLHLARMTKRMTPVVTVYTDGSVELAKQLEPVLAGAGISLDSRQILRLVKGSMNAEVMVEFEDDESKTEGFLVRIRFPLSLLWPNYSQFNALNHECSRFTSPKQKSMVPSRNSCLWS